MVSLLAADIGFIVFLRAYLTRRNAFSRDLHLPDPPPGRKGIHEAIFILTKR